MKGSTPLKSGRGQSGTCIVEINSRIVSTSRSGTVLSPHRRFGGLPPAIARIFYIVSNSLHLHTADPCDFNVSSISKKPILSATLLGRSPSKYKDFSAAIVKGHSKWKFFSLLHLAQFATIQLW